MTDRAEAIRRGQQKPKPRTSHPYIGLEHRVFDSPAFCDLKPSSVVVLLAIMRQLTATNNGHLQATFSWCSKFGIGSEHTLQGAIADLIAHGLIYRTRSHGANGTWARYAVTWQPIKDKTELFLDGFVPNAWRSWGAE